MDEKREQQEAAWRLAFEAAGDAEVRRMLSGGEYPHNMRRAAIGWLAEKERERTKRDFAAQARWIRIAQLRSTKGNVTVAVAKIAALAVGAAGAFIAYQTWVGPHHH